MTFENSGNVVAHVLRLTTGRSSSPLVPPRGTSELRLNARQELALIPIKFEASTLSSVPCVHLTFFCPFDAQSAEHGIFYPQQKHKQLRLSLVTPTFDLQEAYEIQERDGEARRSQILRPVVRKYAAITTSDSALAATSPSKSQRGYEMVVPLTFCVFVRLYYAAIKLRRQPKERPQKRGGRGTAFSATSSFGSHRTMSHQ